LRSWKKKASADMFDLRVLTDFTVWRFHEIKKAPSTTPMLCNVKNREKVEKSELMHT
jgi:hypothetical protein